MTSKTPSIPDNLPCPFNGPTVQNERGGKQSELQYRFDLIPVRAIFKVAHILHGGAVKYGEWNWTNISPSDHINHALTHLYGWLAGDKSEDHIGNATCRLLFAKHLTLPPVGQVADGETGDGEMAASPALPDHPRLTGKKVGLVGPMTGKPEWNHPLFREVAKELRQYNLNVFNPAETDGGSVDKPRQFYLRESLAAIPTCDAIVLLPDWEESYGAAAELVVAEACGIPVYSWPRYERLEANEMQFNIKYGEV
jgi:hypothetical protein